MTQINGKICQVHGLEDYHQNIYATQNNLHIQSNCYQNSNVFSKKYKRYAKAGEKAKNCWSNDSECSDSEGALPGFMSVNVLFYL